MFILAPAGESVEEKHNTEASIKFQRFTRFFHRSILPRSGCEGRAQTVQKPTA